MNPAAPHRRSTDRHGGLKAVVFDFDGLLMDTESTLVEGWRAEWAFHGLNLDLDNGFWPGHGGNITEHRLDRLAAVVGPTFDRTASLARFLAHRDRLHQSMDPAVYHLALDRLGIAGARAIAVEDTPHGVSAARAAGMATVAIPNPFVDVRQFDSADIVLSSAAELRLADVIARLPSHPADRRA